MNLNKYIEHTLLKQDATKAEITKLLDEAIQYDFLGVCVNPCNVKYAKEYLKNSDVKVVTVIGFPLGQNTKEVKILETIDAIKNGADEIDMVINVGLLKDKAYDAIVDEISAIKGAFTFSAGSLVRFISLNLSISRPLLTPQKSVASASSSVVRFITNSLVSFII